MYQIKNAAHAAEILTADHACNAGRITCSGCPMGRLDFSGGYKCGYIIDRARAYTARHGGEKEAQKNER